MIARVRLGSPEKVQEALTALFKEPSLARIAPGDPADPARVLLEVFSLLHWNVLGFLEEEGRGLVEAALSLAGLSRRLPWPAAAVFDAVSKGEYGSQHAFRRSGSGDQDSAAPFGPAWTFYSHGPLDPEAIKGGLRWTMSAARPVDFFVDLESPDDTDLDKALQAVPRPQISEGKSICRLALRRTERRGDGLDRAGGFVRSFGRQRRMPAVFLGRQFLRLSPPRGRGADEPRDA